MKTDTLQQIAAPICLDQHFPALVLSLAADSQQQAWSGHCCAAPRCTVSITKRALLVQEVEKVLFLATSVPHLKGQWQMATQGPSQGPGPGSMGGPLAMRQASCVFLEFAALAVNHHHQPPCCPPISPYEKVGHYMCHINNGALYLPTSL